MLTELVGQSTPQNLVVEVTGFPLIQGTRPLGLCVSRKLLDVMAAHLEMSSPQKNQAKKPLNKDVQQIEHDG